VFVPGKPFQLSLMVVGKAGAYTDYTFGLPHKHYTRLDKHSSLLQKIVNYGQKSFITLVPGPMQLKEFNNLLRPVL
jgi:hypothetical protein